MEFYSFFPGSTNWRRVRQLYITAFPPAERLSMTRLWLASRLRDSVDFRACYENGSFCGFAITVRSEKYLYIPFVAVAPEARGGGLGGNILSALHAEYPALTMLVEVEAPAAGADNQTQRLQRIRFYEKNGFQNLERTITGRGVTYQLYATSQDYDRDAYFALFCQFSLNPSSVVRSLLH